jgi:hypothetical protein
VNARVNASDLRALARKYKALAALRARRDGGGNPAPDRALAVELRALAREFPGCLRELDTLGAAELQRRAASTAAAAQSVDANGDSDAAAHEPWMPWISSYHGLMRAALEIRRRTKASPAHASATTPALATLAADATRIAGVAVDVTFVQAVSAPPQGRIGIVVLRLLATLYQQPPQTIAAALFPLRRPSPYEL